MNIDFKKEAAEIIANLKEVKYNSECERVILYNVKKQFEKGCTEVVIVEYLQKLTLLLENLIKSTRDMIDSFNYRHAVSYLKTITQTPYWRNWIQAKNEEVTNH
jgi:hypothetical protein